MWNAGEGVLEGYNTMPSMSLNGWLPFYQIHFPDMCRFEKNPFLHGESDVYSIKKN